MGPQFLGSQGGKANSLVRQLPVSHAVETLQSDTAVAPGHSGVGRARKPDRTQIEGPEVTKARKPSSISQEEL